jgi:hypothetical protein
MVHREVSETQNLEKRMMKMLRVSKSKPGSSNKKASTLHAMLSVLLAKPKKPLATLSLGSVINQNASQTPNVISTSPKATPSVPMTKPTNSNNSTDPSSVPSSFSTKTLNALLKKPRYKLGMRRRGERGKRR